MHVNKHAIPSSNVTPGFHWAVVRRRSRKAFRSEVDVYHQANPAADRYLTWHTERCAMKTDRELQQDVSAELIWDPSVDDSRIVVEARGGTVTLAGQVGSHSQKWCAEAAALRVGGVKGLVSQLVVELPNADRRPDQEIAKAAHQMLAWNAMVPAGKVKVAVEGGRITLSGEVEWEYQSNAAELALRNLIGTRDLLNLIQIRPRAEPGDVTRHIEAALRRCARTHPKAISIAVNGGTVTLSGELDSWRERNAVRRAAWAAPGIRNVVDQTTIIG